MNASVAIHFHSQSFSSTSEAVIVALNRMKFRRKRICAFKDIVNLRSISWVIIQPEKLVHLQGSLMKAIGRLLTLTKCSCNKYRYSCNNIF